jgi:signal transduction histidine kinase/ActR/RegA family two-component response regulator
MQISRFFKNHVENRTKSFTTKIYLTLISSIVIISFAITASFIFYLKKTQTEILINKGELLAEQLAENSRIGIYAGNKELLDAPLNSAMRQKESLAANIVDTSGVTLTGRQKTEFPSYPESKSRSTEEIQKIMMLVDKSQKPVCLFNKNTIEFWSPVRYEMHFAPSEALFLTDNPGRAAIRTIGYVKVILGKKQLDESFRTLLINSIAITAIFLALVLMVAFFVTKSITRPLSILKEGVLTLGKGTSVEKIPVKTMDEVGELATAFNTMAESLQMREQEKEHLTAQLLHAQKMEAIGTLAGGIAHDFNNILTAIIGYAHLILMKTAEDDPSRNYVNQIRNSADRAAELTQGLLAFSRKQIMISQAVDINETMLHLQKILRRLVRENIELKMETAVEKLYSMADRGKIEQVLMNLATNASDAMPDGGAMVLSSCRKTMDAEFLHTHGYGKQGEYVCITFSDSGTGMDEETKSKIFEPFFTTKDVGKGTGLGLAIVYGIVKQHNGYINVYSEPGKGTTFRIYLPLIEAKTETPQKKFELRTSRGTETILLAEDDPAVNKFHRTLLEVAGYKVITATDGEDALGKFIEHEDDISLLILDVIMPRINGKKVFDTIRKANPRIKAMFLSGYPAEMVRGEGIGEGNAVFLTKPVDPAELLKSVRDTLDGKDQ